MDGFVAKLDKTGKWLWAVKAGGSEGEYINDLGLDGSGNPYVTGYHQGITTFGSTSISSKGGTDVFVAKLDTSGTWQWAVTAGTSGYDYGDAIAVDSAGNGYVTGSAGKNAVFGSSTLAPGLTSYENVFVAKIDKTGKWLWAKSGDGAFPGNGRSIDLDSSNNIYVAGRLAGVATLGSTTLGAIGNYRTFMAKMDGTGKWLWANLAISNSSPPNLNFSTPIVAHGGTTVVGGSFFGQGFFGPAISNSIKLSSQGKGDAFLATLDSTGSVTKAEAIRGLGSSNDIGSDLVRDSAGNTYVTGYFQGNATFGTTKLASIGDDDIVVAKLDSSGKWLWAKNAGGVGSDDGLSIDLDSSGNAYITGSLSEEAAFGTIYLAGTGQSIFAAKLDPTGKWLWAKGTTKNSKYYQGAGRGITVGAGGGAHVTGHFSGAQTFGKASLASEGNADLFVWQVLP